MPPFCNKVSYPDRETAEWHKPFREKKVGMRLWVYRCQSRACRPWRRWHMTSKGNPRSREFDMLARWADDGGMDPKILLQKEGVRRRSCKRRNALSSPGPAGTPRVTTRDHAGTSPMRPT